VPSEPLPPDARHTPPLHCAPYHGSSGSSRILACVWYTPLFFLYSTAYPVLVWLGQRPEKGPIKDVLLLEFLALCAFLLGVGSSQVRTVNLRPLPSASVKAGWAILIATGVGCLYFIWTVYAAGLASARQIVGRTSLFQKFGFTFPVFALAYGTLLCDSFVARRSHAVRWALVAGANTLNLLSLLVLGQRADLLRILWITTVVLHLGDRRFGRRVMIISASTLLILLPGITALKNALVRGGDAEHPRTNTALEVLQTEFVSASENLAELLGRLGSTRLYGETVLWDLAQLMRPALIYQERSTRTPTNWFNDLVYPDVFRSGGGQGFTLVGEGYINFGPAGVFIWFLGFALFTRFLYVRAGHGVAWLSMYVVAMPLLAYVTRADFSNLLSQFLKHVCLPLAAILVPGMICRGEGVEVSGGSRSGPAREIAGDRQHALCARGRWYCLEPAAERGIPGLAALLGHLRGDPGARPREERIGGGSAGGGG